MKIGSISATLISLLLAACAAPTPREPLKGHLNTESSTAAPAPNITPPVQQTLALPKPRTARKAETYEWNPAVDRQNRPKKQLGQRPR